jgi:hypothetical protein
MTKAILTALAILLCSTAFADDAPAPEPLLNRCIEVVPVCPPGTHPMCICESDLSYECHYICASQ